MALNEFPGFDSTAKGGKGGLWGKIAGAALSAGSVAAAPFTAGTSLAALPVGLGLGAVAAPVVGNALDPTKVEPGVTKPNMLETAAKQDPHMTLALLDQGKKDAVGRQDIPREQLHPIINMIDDAKRQIQERMQLA